MIHNPHISAFYKYDPYGKLLTRESYGYDEMYALRRNAITTATTAKKWGLILGTLGRQGNMNILSRIESLLKEKNRDYIIVLLSEIFPDKLAKFTEVEASGRTQRHTHTHTHMRFEREKEKRSHALTFILIDTCMCVCTVCMLSPFFVFSVGFKLRVRVSRSIGE